MILTVKRIVRSILGRVMVIVTTITTYVAATGMAAIAVDTVIKGINTIIAQSVHAWILLFQITVMDVVRSRSGREMATVTTKIITAAATGTVVTAAGRSQRIFIVKIATVWTPHLRTRLVALKFVYHHPFL